jgi:hypothetical protein
MSNIKKLFSPKTPKLTTNSSAKPKSDTKPKSSLFGKLIKNLTGDSKAKGYASELMGKTTQTKRYIGMLTPAAVTPNQSKMQGPYTGKDLANDLRAYVVSGLGDDPQTIKKLTEFLKKRENAQLINDLTLYKSNNSNYLKYQLIEIYYEFTRQYPTTI